MRPGRWLLSAVHGERQGARSPITSRETHALVNLESSLSRTPGRVLGIGLLLLALATRIGGSAETTTAMPGPGRNVLAFDRFVAASTPVCLHGPAAACVEMGWAFANRNEDQGLSVVELEEVRDELRDWAHWRADDLHATERSLLALGFVVVDGLVDRDELLADVRLDERPLGEVLLDREAVDRAAIAARLGLPPVLIERLQP
jgi:hypothetical protein